MNNHILFVIDHLANPDKYTKEQLDANANAASEVFQEGAYSDDSDDSDDAAYYADAAAYYANAASANAASHWVDEYLKDTGEYKQDYINAINSRG
tara:strand:- start:476 stop:760 length:285 start_codon:yes stop_codon:yes gene_type:complete